ncbi:MAG: hypothetical protein OXU61_09400 [Gammaproteobacteria bacterium]|nr:hypothetical protein [Gammaproteobacteria bacterium]
MPVVAPGESPGAIAARPLGGASPRSAARGCNNRRRCRDSIARRPFAHVSLAGNGWYVIGPLAAILRPGTGGVFGSELRRCDLFWTGALFSGRKTRPGGMTTCIHTTITTRPW